MSTAIRVENLGKRYQLHLGRPAQGYRTLREGLADLAKAPLRRLRSGAPVETEDFWALRDVEFEVPTGEVLGIIGRNGAGKSTLLKILSRITKPTTGRVALHGRVGSLLEVGTGFHPELTGRENIYLNGSILGMSRREITRCFDEIVAFAEVEKFLDTPVKRYSSGMYVRLAFAVAAHLEPEILVVDEVLAVGDSAFQKKCLGKMGEVTKKGRTVLFVSHNMAAVSALCTCGLVLSSGSVVFNGDIQDAIGAYLSSLERPQTDGPLGVSDDGLVELSGIRIEDRRGNVLNTVLSGQDVDFVIDIRSKVEIDNIVTSIGVDNTLRDRVFHMSSRLFDEPISIKAGVNQIRCRLPKMPLVPGNYTLSPQVSIPGRILIWAPNSVPLRIEGGDFFGSGRIIEAPWMGVALVSHEWISS